MIKPSEILAELQAANCQTPVNTGIVCRKEHSGENEFLLILKPEIFAFTRPDQQISVIEIILNRLAQYKLSVSSFRVINAAYLEKYTVIAQHYGIINAAARDFKSVITDELQRNFEMLYGQELANSKVYGSIELSGKVPGITKEILQNLWSGCEIKRLSGGIYCGEINYDNEKIYLINGFHPPQIEHFTSEGRIVVTMNVSGDLDWIIARQQLIGNTYPEKAEKGSLRRDLSDQFGKLGFDAVSYVINYVHLSAGPLEALIELQRFNSDFQNHTHASFFEFGFGNRLRENFSEEQCRMILSNPTVLFDGKESSLYDLTEELNSADALVRLKRVVG